MLQSWRNQFDNSSTSFKDFRINTFNTKVITNGLPTGCLLEHRYGGLFKNMLCSICNQQRETYEHIWVCPLNSNNIDFVIVTAVVEALEEQYILDAPRIQQLESILLTDSNTFLIADLTRGFTLDFVNKINKFLEGVTSSKKLIPHL